MTVNDLELVVGLLKNDGNYDGDPQCRSVWTYLNDWGVRTYAICYNLQSEGNLIISPSVKDPEMLWAQYCGLTDRGKGVLASWNASLLHTPEGQPT